jgi:molybdate transport system substrate-binding protein
MTLHILSAGAAKGLVLGMQPRFAQQHGVGFECAFGAVGAMRDKLLAGERCDLIILTAALIDTLIEAGQLVAGTRADIGRVLTGIAVPSSQRGPDVSDADALRAALLQAGGIYLPDPERATAGIHFASVLRKLGIHDAVRARLRPHPSGAVAMRAMADASDAGESDLIGCTQVTEIRYTSGVQLAGLLPAEFELATLYAAGVCRNAAQPALAREFAAILASPESIELRRSGGFVE